MKKSNRRKFLTNSSVLGAATFVAPTIFSSSLFGCEAPSNQITLALIGVRNMGWNNLRNLLKQPNVVCKTLCDVDNTYLEDRAAKLVKMGHKKPHLEKDYRKVIEDKDIDAVIVGTPDHWHALPMVEASSMGKHVYVEKPLANSIGEINVMLDAANKYGNIVQVGQQQRSGTHWQSAVEFVQSGKLGTIRQVKCWSNFNYGAGRPHVPDSAVPAGVDYNFWLGPAPQRLFNENRFHRYWRFSWDYGGGMMTDWGAHLFDIALWAMKEKGAPKSVFSMGGNFANHDRAIEVPDTLSTIYEMEGYNLVWELNAGIQTGPYDQNYGIKFIGSNGTLVANRDKWFIVPEIGEGITKAKDSLPVDKSKDISKEHNNYRVEPVEQKSQNISHADHCKNFVNAIRNGEKLQAGIEVGHHAALYAHLGNLSYRANERVVYDWDKRRITNSSKSNGLIIPEYRVPWKFPKI